MAPAYAVPKMLARAGLDAPGLRLLRDPRGVRRPGPVHAEGVGGPGLLPRAPRARSTAGRDRPRQAQRPRRLARRRAPVRRHRRTDRRHPGQGPARDEPAPGRGLISICAAGGLGVTAIMEAALMTDRYQQLVNTPIGKIVSKQIGLPNPPRLERYQPGQPVISGPVLLGAAAGRRLAGALAGVLASVGAEVLTPMDEELADRRRRRRARRRDLQPRRRRRATSASRRSCSTPPGSRQRAARARRGHSCTPRSGACCPVAA